MKHFQMRAIKAEGDVKRQYDRLARIRDNYLWRARRCAAVTIPHLMPEVPNYRRQQGQDLPDGFQSLGARGVNNLASKLVMVLFPVNQKFFRLRVDQGSVINREMFRRERAEIEDSLAVIEDMGMEEMEVLGLRFLIFEVMRQLIVSGNALLYMPPNDDPRVFRLDSYVVERDPQGRVMRIITHQEVQPAALEETLRKRLAREGVQAKGDCGDEAFDVYTVCVREGGDSWVEWQEVEGQMIDTPVRHKKDRAPYMALRWNRSAGEDYGRGHVEEFYGDLISYEKLREAMLDAAFAASRVIPLVDPDGVTNLQELDEAENGIFTSGKADDVSFLHLEKANDMGIAQREATEIKQDLARVFLLNSSVTRQAERVTAEEIRLVAQELEDTLGGVYGNQSADLQMPMVRHILARLKENGAIEDLPDSIRPVIVTGLDAIGRGHDVIKMQQLFEMMGQMFGPEAIAQVDVSKAWRAAGTGLGVDVSAFLKTPEEMQAMAQQQQMQAAVSQLGPDVIKQFPEEVRAAAAQMSSPPAA